MISIILAAFIAWSLLFFKGSNASIVQKIHDDVLVGYDKFIRPAKNLSDITTVRLNPGLYCLVEVNTAAQQITLKQWYRMYWNDAFLTWDPSQYGGVSQIKISRAKVWLPDIMIYSITDTNQLDDDKYVVILDSDGNIKSSIDQQVTVYNYFDVALFPYDTQNVTLIYSSWNYNANEIDVNVTQPTDIANYIENNEWALLNYTAVKSTYTTSGGGTFVTANYNIIIQRKPSFYISTFVWPSFIITCLSIIGVFSPFNEAGEREERVTLGLTTLLTMAVVLMIITDQTPKSSTGMPLLGTFIMAEIGVSAIVTIIATIIIYLHSSWLKNDPVPNFLLVITRLPTKKKSSADISATNTKVKKANTRHTNMSEEFIVECEREKLRQEWSTATKRLDTILLIIFLIINCIIVAIFLLVGNWKLRNQ